MTADLVAWLRQQLDHDEQVARAAHDPTDPASWRSLGGLAAGVSPVVPPWRVRLSVLVDHIALHDPARVLRQVAAHRAILDAYESALKSNGYVRYGDWESCSDGCPEEIMRRVVLSVAAIYSDREGFDPAWKVDRQ